MFGNCSLFPTKTENKSEFMHHAFMYKQSKISIQKLELWREATEFPSSGIFRSRRKSTYTDCGVNSNPETGTGLRVCPEDQQFDSVSVPDPLLGRGQEVRQHQSYKYWLLNIGFEQGTYLFVACFLICINEDNRTQFIVIIRIEKAELMHVMHNIVPDPQWALNTRYCREIMLSVSSTTTPIKNGIT